jgi:hypothetical protein
MLLLPWTQRICHESGPREIREAQTARSSRLTIPVPPAKSREVGFSECAPGASCGGCPLSEDPAYWEESAINRLTKFEREEAGSTVERIRVARDDDNPEGTLKVAVSKGVASSESPSAIAPDALIPWADKAMYAGIGKASVNSAERPLRQPGHPYPAVADRDRPTGADPGALRAWPNTQSNPRIL